MVPFPSRRVTLIVDQDADTRQMYAQYLRLADFDVDEAEEGREALAKALGRRYDVIVTDIRLPGLDGYELTRILRVDPSTEHVPILVVTGEGSSSAVERAMNAGANAVFVKPSLPETVLAEVRRLLPPASVLDEGQDGHGRVRMSHILNRSYQRGATLAPPVKPPDLACPQCHRLLTYQRSYLGGVSARHAEQWDEYECPNGCGSFQYRQRTRRIRRR
jgi:DNA-binding response OmpR family regulator